MSATVHTEPRKLLRMSPSWWLACMTISLMSLTMSGAAHASAFKGLVDPEGEPASLSNTIGNGKWTLVMVWATDCHLCTEQKPKISAFYNEHKDDDANVVGIAIDGPKKLKLVREYLAKHKPTFPNYVADIRTLGLTYQNLTEEQFRGTPTYLLFDPSGELKGNNPGPVTVAGVEKFIASHSK
ncbi:MAG: TlpA family protein disulfide reductase [Gammaproteobacteria bacterium]|nr:TlpA family protein disulfide reductase [Gammaproteobacteria bacterium]